jgi:hypothetical protein
MTPAERTIWRLAMRRAAAEEPAIARAMLTAFRVIRETLSESELAHLIQSGNLDRLVSDVLSKAATGAALQPVRERMRAATESSFRYVTATSLPGAGKVDGLLTVRFDYLNPRVIDAVRTMESKVITALATTTRDTVRAYVENGLRDGVGPGTIARGLRQVIGLSPSQLQEVTNFRAVLAGDTTRSLSNYALRDARLDAMLADGPLSPEQIDRYAERYLKRRIAQNAETIAHTASLDAMKLGQRLSWQDAIDKGIIDGDVQKAWIGVMDDRERPEHVKMQGETVGFDEPFSNGEVIPGESTYNCRCLPRYSVARPAASSG